MASRMSSSSPSHNYHALLILPGPDISIIKIYDDDFNTDGGSFYFVLIVDSVIFISALSKISKSCCKLVLVILSGHS